MNKRKIILLIVSSAFMSALIIVASYAIVTGNITTDEIEFSTIPMTDSHVFSAYFDKSIYLGITEEMSSQDASSVTPVALDSAKLTISLTPKKDIFTACTYEVGIDLPYISSDKSIPSTNLPYIHTDGSIYPYEFSFEVENLVPERDISYYLNTSDGILFSDTVVADNNETKTVEYVINARMYNLPIYQQAYTNVYYNIGLYVSNIECSGYADTDFVFASEIPEGTNLSDGIINLASDITYTSSDYTGQWKVEDNKGYRYVGDKPENYICFQKTESGTCDYDYLYRIVGTFEENYYVEGSDGPTTAYLPKVIGTYKYYNSYYGDNNNWLESELFEDMTFDYSYYFSDEIKSLIVNANWYLGGMETGDFTSDEVYENERSGNVYAENYAINAYVPYGLLYISDFMYAGFDSICSRDLPLAFYDKECYTNNWVYNVAYGSPSITHISSSSDYIFSVEGKELYVYSSADYYPSFYLSPEVKIKSGKGTYRDPYFLTL